MVDALKQFGQVAEAGMGAVEDASQKVREVIGFKPMELNTLTEKQYGQNRGEYDVTMDYNWTINGKQARGKNIPYMKLTQYQMDGNLLLSNLNYWVKQITEPSDNNNPYNALYKARPTGITFKFPWLKDYNHTIGQNWGEYKGLESTAAGDILTKVAMYATNTPGIAVNTPKVWSGPNGVTVPYDIILFNTGEPTEIDKNIDKNKKLINRLIMSTLHDQTNAILALPPALYEMQIPGVRVSPACIISSLDITNIGTLVLKKGRTVPEAYNIKFTITELISESRQIFDGVNGGKVVTAIDSGDTNES